MRLAHVRFLAVSAAILLTWNGRPIAQQQKLQLALQEMNNAEQSAHVEVARLEQLLATPATAKDYAKQRAQCVNNLKQIALALHRNAQTLQDLAVQKDTPGAARSSIVNGYSAEFYAGSRLEFEQAANAFPLKAGAGDAEAFKKLSSAADKLKKAAESLRR